MALAGAAILYTFLGAPGLPQLASSTLRIAAASAVMGVACLLSSRAVHAFAVGKLAQLADVAISIPLGAAVFYAAARAFRLEELQALKSACYTAIRNAPRPEVGDPSAGN